jgi:uncharacterized protein YhdP
MKRTIKACLIVALVVLALGCAKIVDKTSWVTTADSVTVTRERSYWRAGMALHGTATLTTNTLSLDLNPKPESTADIINATSKAIISATGSAVTAAK